MNNSSNLRIRVGVNKLPTVAADVNIET